MRWFVFFGGRGGRGRVKGDERREIDRLVPDFDRLRVRTGRTTLAVMNIFLKALPCAF